MAKSTSSETFVIENCILSYPHLFQPEQFKQNGVPQGDPFYSAVLLVTPEAASIINQKAAEVAQRHYTNGEQNHASFGWPCQPANLKPEYANNPRTAGLYMVNAKAGQNFPPQVVDGNRQPVIDRGQIYSGCVVAAGVNVYTRPQPARPGEVGQGVGVGLKAIMKQGDGEALGGDAVDANALFSGVAGAPAPAPGGAPAPAPGGAPAPAPGFMQPQGLPKPPYPNS